MADLGRHRRCRHGPRLRTHPVQRVAGPVGLGAHRVDAGTGPDYSKVDKIAAEVMVAKGMLQKLLLLPKEFGGHDTPRNVVFVPPFAVESKNHIDVDVIGPLVKKGTITRYEAIPKYQGQSFVPIAIEIVASQPGQFRAVVNIWGDALHHN